MKKYLKDFDNCKVLELLKEFEEVNSIVVVYLIVYPKVGRTGMLDERRSLLRQIWDGVFEEIGTQKMGGCVAGWTDAFFATNHKEEKLIISVFQKFLKSKAEPNFRSFCIIGKVENNLEEHSKMLDFMVHHAGSEDNFYRDAHGMIRMIDGKII